MTDKTLRTSRTIPLTLLRLGVGVIMAVHGAMKLWDLSATQQQFANMGIPLAEVAAPLSMFGELAGGLALAFGLLTPVAAALITINMLVAVIAVHLPNGLLAKDGGFEYPLTLALVGLFFVFRGGGPASIDAWLAKRSEGGEGAGRAAIGLHPSETGT